MKATVGVGELRQNLSKFLRRVERGERLVVTDRNRPVAELAPLREEQSAVQRLGAEGRAQPARNALDFKPIKLQGRFSASGALRDVRGEGRRALRRLFRAREARRRGAGGCGSLRQRGWPRGGAAR